MACPNPGARATGLLAGDRRDYTHFEALSSKRLCPICGGSA
jgi:rubredoxin